MLFNEPNFIFAFLPLTVAIGLILLKLRTYSPVFVQCFLAFITLSSFFFYAQERFEWLFILLASVIVNYLFSRAIGAAEQRSGTAWSLSAAAIAFNLALLGWFKYATFVAGELGFQSFPEIALPIGISFYTFQQIAYIADTYSGKMHDRSFLRYAFFVTFYPQLIAGPIVHHAEIMPQLKEANGRGFGRNLSIGLALFFTGLAKKLLIADSVAPIADEVFIAADAGDPITQSAALLGVLAYTSQIYFDFSGYSDMAIGIGFMFGLKLPINFSSPYQSTSIIDFWRRWHITLSRFLRDYLYIPLGGNRRGNIRRFANLFITMLLGGIWHGAGWGFLIWGALHGAYLIVNHAINALRLPQIMGRLPGFKFASFAIVFLAVALAWVPFRATTFEGMHSIYQALLLGEWTSSPVGAATPFALTVLGLSGVLAILFPNSQQIVGSLFGEQHLQPGSNEQAKQFQRAYIIVLAVACAFAIALNNQVAQFIYFQF